MNPEQLKIAVVGSGYWGKNLIRNYQDLNVLKLICDKNEALLSSYQKQLPNVDVCLAFNDVLGRKDIDGVVIATPAETHFTLAREALLAGKHVFVEKPLVLDEGEGRELIHLAGNNSLVLMVGHLLRYHPAFIHLKDLVQKGELGRINYIYSHRLNLGKIRREENILWSFAPHDISMILALAGENPESVVATGGNYLHQRIADVTTTHMTFSSGLQAHIFVSWLHPFKEQKLVVVGDRKMAVFDDTQPWKDKLLLYPHEIKWQQNMPVPTKAQPDRVMIEEQEPLRMECRHFLDCISKKKRPVTDGDEGLRVLRVLNASQVSLDQKSNPIFLNQCDSSNKAGLAKRDHASLHISDMESRHAAEHFFVHDTAFVDDKCTIGKDAKIWHFSHILSGSRIGDRCNIGQNVMIGPEVTIGNGCKIQNNVSIYKGVTLEDEVFCGPSAVFTNVYNPRAHIRRMDEIRPTLVKKRATLGANATVVCGVTIGKYAFVGAGAVVNKDVLDHALVVGSPGRRIGWMCACGVRLDDRLTCPACGLAHIETEKGLEEKSL